MYHAIGDAGESTGTQQYNDAAYTLSVGQFDSHLQYLQRNNFKSVRLRDVDFSKREDEKTIVISFDDGHYSDINVVLPILQQYGMVAEFFITTDWIGRPGYMQENDILSLVQAGMGVGSHGVSHQFFSDMSDEQARAELQDSADRLKAITGQAIESFSAPGGQLHDSMKMLAIDCGYKYCCTSEVAVATRQKYPWAIPRIAMRDSTGLREFQEIVEQYWGFYRKAQLRSTVLTSIRQILGNDRFMRLREKLL